MDYRYTKKPITIEAFQMTCERRQDNTEWPSWMHEAWNYDAGSDGSLFPAIRGSHDSHLVIGTLEGSMLVGWGDWIIRGVKGELYPCKNDIFEATYDQGAGT